MNWAEINTEIDYFSGDDGSVSYAAPKRISAWNTACDYFAQTHTARLKSLPITTLGAGDVIPLPADFLILAGIHDLATNSFLPKNIIQDGGDYFSTGYIETSSGIMIVSALPKNAVLWYYAPYEMVVDDNSEITTPRFAKYALQMLTMALLINPQMLSEASLSRFDSTRDKGTPIDNSMRAQAAWYLQQYENSLKGIPAQQRSFYSLKK